MAWGSPTLSVSRAAIMHAVSVCVLSDPHHSINAYYAHPRPS
jgi:hypothetical protein